MGNSTFKNLKKALASPNEVETLLVKLQTDEIPCEIYNFPNLKTLYLQGPNLTKVSSSLFEIKTLVTLDLKGCAIEEIPEIRNKNNILKNLYLSNNNLLNLNPTIQLLENLDTLLLNGNKLTSLPNEFINLRKLSRLNIDSNKFQKLPDVLVHMTNLKHLSMDNNSFSEDEISRIERVMNIWL